MRVIKELEPQADEPTISDINVGDHQQPTAQLLLNTINILKVNQENAKNTRKSNRHEKNQSSIKSRKKKVATKIGGGGGRSNRVAPTVSEFLG